MTWDDLWAARQLLVEEHIGVHLRAAQRAEADKVDATIAAIRRADGSS